MTLTSTLVTKGFLVLAEKFDLAGLEISSRGKGQSSQNPQRAGRLSKAQALILFLKISQRSPIAFVY